MTDQLPIDELDETKDLTAERNEHEVEYILSLLAFNVKTVLDWYYDSDAFLNLLGEKLGKTAVKKLLEEVEARYGVVEEPPF